MSSFAIEVDDPNGRQGVLNIGRGHVMTPAYVPSEEVFHAMGDIPEGARWQQSCISECDLWVQRSDIGRIRLYPEDKVVMEEAACERMDRMHSAARLMHLNFFSDVAELPKETVVDLLRLQYRAGADVIEIPHAACNTQSYERVVRHALEWQQNSTSETPLMAIARTTADLAMLDHYLPQLGGVGIDCRRFDIPLLSQVRGSLKDRDVWVHAFSPPFQCHGMQNQGTLGMLINWFGVDTVSTTALSEDVRQYFTVLASMMDEQERAEFVRKNHYFDPSDYSMFTFDTLQELYGPEQQLSRFCDCPVCRNKTIGEAMGDLSDFDMKNRLHAAFAYGGEAEKYRRALVHHSTDQFIKTKPFAAEILSRMSVSVEAHGGKRSDQGPVGCGSPGAARTM